MTFKINEMFRFDVPSLIYTGESGSGDEYQKSRGDAIRAPALLPFLHKHSFAHESEQFALDRLLADVL